MNNSYPYVCYHKHSCVSNIMITDSVVTNEDYAKRAIELGQTILSSCEHGTQGNYWQCADLAEKYGINWRYVCEAYFVKDRFAKDNANCHIILAARTRKGIGDLNFALSEANLTGYYYRPRIDMELLMSLDPRDVFVTTACVGGIFKYGDEEAEKLIRRLSQHFRDSFMLEVQYHNTEKQKEVNRFILTMYRRYGIPLIMGTDSHFIYPEEAVLRDQRLEANHIRYEDEDGWYMDYPTGEEAYRRFVEQGILSDAQIREAIENTNVFLSFENVTFDHEKKLPTIYPNLSMEERNSRYLQTVYDEWNRYSAPLSDEEKERRLEGIRYETDTITSTGVADYFLINHEIVNRAKEMGGVITATGRGSGVSYLTNMLLGFSSVDRYSIPVEMFPDRFISADRILSGSLPDLDTNVANEEVFWKAQSEVLGEWRSAPMIAYGTLKRLSAWKMYCRANNVPFETANTIAGQLKEYETDLRFAEDDDKDEIDVHDYVPQEYHELIDRSQQYLGIIDSVSPHPCAHLLCREDIRREIGIIRIASKGSKKRVVYAAFIDGATAEYFGYLKNDILHVDVVKINRDAFNRIGIPQPSVGELLELTKNDRETWRMYADGLTLGINQVEQPKTREKVMRYKPQNITELSAFVAAVRPAFKSMLDIFLARQHFDYGIPALDQLVQTREMTSSFIIYQEQIMKILQTAGFTAPESYAAIKAISKKKAEKVKKLKDQFLEGFTKLTGDMEISEKVWTIINDATSYLFNASHAVCVALDSLYGAYLKAHYPLEYYTTLLSNYAAKGDKDRIALVKEEMLRGFGIRVVPCRFRQDNRDFYIDHDARTISDALTSVKHISRRVADTLYDWREDFFPRFVDLLYEMEMNPAFDSQVVEILIRIGYF